MYKVTRSQKYRRRVALKDKSLKATKGAVKRERYGFCKLRNMLEDLRNVSADGKKDVLTWVAAEYKVSPSVLSKAKKRKVLIYQEVALWMLLLEHWDSVSLG